MAKRKRDNVDQAGPKSAMKVKSGTAKPQEQQTNGTASKQVATRKHQEEEDEQAQISKFNPWGAENTTIQVVTGSYERVLHGLTATIPTSLVTGPANDLAENGVKSMNLNDSEAPKVTFTDTFLFNAHASSIRCLALSPPTEDPNGKVLLATGSTDERINVYSISLCPPVVSKNKPVLPTLHGMAITENSKNKELGSLLHHSSTITALHFPSRSKLLSSSEDSTIAITRTRDWETLSSIKAPIPKPQGRPSGDTAAPGEVPAGVTDFAVHPSNKLMLSVGKGEKCMRLWNLVTGKKAGVLSFSREILSAVGEGRFGTGEGKRVIWDAEGEEFAVAFERGVAVFGIDCKLKAHIIPTPRTKIHQMQYLPGTPTENAEAPGEGNVIAISTEDGRIMFYDTSVAIPTPTETDTVKDDASESAPGTLIAQLGGPAAGITGRIKDFEILPIPSADWETTQGFLVVAGSSDGSVRLWSISADELDPEKSKPAADEEATEGYTAKQVGKLIGTCSTGTRITCLKAFVMTGKPAEDDAQDEQENGKSEPSSDEESE